MVGFLDGQRTGEGGGQRGSSSNQEEVTDLVEPPSETFRVLPPVLQISSDGAARKAELLPHGFKVIVSQRSAQPLQRHQCGNVGFARNGKFLASRGQNGHARVFRQGASRGIGDGDNFTPAGVRFEQAQHLDALARLRDGYDQRSGIEEPALVVHQFRSLNHDGDDSPLDEFPVRRMERVKRRPHASKDKTTKFAIPQSLSQGGKFFRAVETGQGSLEGPRLVQNVVKVRPFENREISSHPTLRSLSRSFLSRSVVLAFWC